MKNNFFKNFKSKMGSLKSDNLGSKFGSSFNNLKNIKFNDVKNVFSKFKSKSNNPLTKQNVTGLNEKHKGLAVFQNQMSPSKVVATILKPTKVAPFVGKAAAKESMKFAVAVYDNSPKLVKSWFRGFSGFFEAFRGGKERFISLPEIIKIKAYRALFELLLVVIIAIAFGLGFGLSHTKVKYQNISAWHTSNWKQSYTNSIMTSYRDSVSYELDLLSFNKFTSNNSINKFYIENFYSTPNNVNSSQFKFYGNWTQDLGIDTSSSPNISDSAPFSPESYVISNSSYNWAYFKKLSQDQSNQYFLPSSYYSFPEDSEYSNALINDDYVSTIYALSDNSSNNPLKVQFRTTNGQGQNHVNFSAFVFIIYGNYNRSKDKNILSNPTVQFVILDAGSSDHALPVNLNSKTQPDKLYNLSGMSFLGTTTSGKSSNDYFVNSFKFYWNHK